MARGETQMLEEGEHPSPDTIVIQEESTREEGMVAGLTAGPHGSMPFSTMTVAFTHEEWSYSGPALRDRSKEGRPDKARNLVLLGLPVSRLA